MSNDDSISLTVNLPTDIHAIYKEMAEDAAVSIEDYIVECLIQGAKNVRSGDEGGVSTPEREIQMMVEACKELEKRRQKPDTIEHKSLPKKKRPNHDNEL